MVSLQGWLISARQMIIFNIYMLGAGYTLYMNLTLFS